MNQKQQDIIKRFEESLKEIPTEELTKLVQEINEMETYDQISMEEYFRICNENI